MFLICYYKYLVFFIFKILTRIFQIEHKFAKVKYKILSYFKIVFYKLVHDLKKTHTNSVFHNQICIKKMYNTSRFFVNENFISLTKVEYYV